MTVDYDKKYVLAVSGGVDSMVMLHKFANLQPRPEFFVATVNHGIRKEAASDCKFVADYCKKLGVACQEFFVDVPSYAEKNKLSLETAARILRYEVLDGIQADVICLAHNANDNAETVIMHILRGSGVKGACGISRQNGKYFRPLLDLTRKEIEQYAEEHNVPFVKDATNDDVRYTRNFIRHKVMPILTESNPAAVENILRFAANAREESEFLDGIAAAYSVKNDNGVVRVPTEWLKKPRPVAYRIFINALRELGITHDVEKVHFEAVSDLICSNGGKKINLPFGIVAYNDYDSVTFCAEKLPVLHTFEVPFAEGEVETPLGTVCVSATAVSGSLKIDIDKVPSDAVFRTRREDDFFTKFGGGTKPLNKYLINKKISERTRDELLLLASGREILAIVGVEISEKLRVSAQPHYLYLKNSK